MKSQVWGSQVNDQLVNSLSRRILVSRTFLLKEYFGVGNKYIQGTSQEIYVVLDKHRKDWINIKFSNVFRIASELNFSQRAKPSIYAFLIFGMFANLTEEAISRFVLQT